MKSFKVRDDAVVVVLSKGQATALYQRTQQHTGIHKSKVLIVAEEKILYALTLATGEAQ